MTADNLKPEEFFGMLNAIRDEGSVNPIAYAPTFLREEFGLSRSDARTVVLAWMKSFRSNT